MGCCRTYLLVYIFMTIYSNFKACALSPSSSMWTSLRSSLTHLSHWLLSDISQQNLPWIPNISLRPLMTHCNKVSWTQFSPFLLPTNICDLECMKNKSLKMLTQYLVLVCVVEVFLKSCNPLSFSVPHESSWAIWRWALIFLLYCHKKTIVLIKEC